MGSSPTSGTKIFYHSRGAVAQLEERVHGMHEVRGSSPLSSTISPGEDLSFYIPKNNSIFKLTNRLYKNILC